MIAGVGIDIIEIVRIERLMENARFLTRCFSEEEIEYFRSRQMRAEVVAGSFAAKEAFAKALGRGFRGFGFRDVEILRNDKGKPYARFKGGGGLRFHVSISHCRQYATACVIAERIEPK